MRQDLEKKALRKSRMSPHACRRKGRHVAWKDAPQREAVPKRSWHEFFYANAFLHYLNRQVGRSWDAICTDLTKSKHSALFMAAMRHYKPASKPSYEGGLFLDENNILRRHKPQPLKEVPQPAFHRLSKYRGVVFWKGCWYECQMAWWIAKWTTNAVHYPHDALLNREILQAEAIVVYGKATSSEFGMQFCKEARPLSKEEIRKLPHYITGQPFLVKMPPSKKR